jgi:hypothetical protein
MACGGRTPPLRLDESFVARIEGAPRPKSGKKQTGSGFPENRENNREFFKFLIF